MKKISRLLSLCWATIFLTGILTFQATAQQATLNGIITDFKTGETLEGANVRLINLDNPDQLLGAAADRDGIYSVNRIDPGSYRVIFSFLGYVTQEDTLTFAANESRSMSVELSVNDVDLGELTVVQRTSAARSEMGRQRISSVDVSRISSPVAGGDLVNYLQVMPGVVSLGNRGGQLFIRGGTPAENMVLVDGSLVYKPFHILSFFSPFPDNLVSSADFYPGGFNSEFSGRISSVLDVSMRNGDRFEFGGSGSVSPFLADVMFEGPIKEDQLSIIVSAKQSFIDETSSWYLSEQQPLKFQSQYIKLSNSNPESSCSGTFMRTKDEGKINTQKDETVEWSNFVIGMNCQALNDQNFFRFNSHISNLSNASIFEDRTYESAITQFRTDLSLSKYYGKVRADYGVLFRIEWMNYDLIGRVNGLADNEFDLLSTGGNVQFSIPLGDKITIEPGAVLSLYNNYPASIEPRVRLSYLPFGEGGGEINAAAGIYRQAVFGFTDSRDATGVFVTWNSIPGDSKQSEARHALLGWQQGIGNYFNYSIEVYYKDLYDIPVSTWSPIARFSTNLRLTNGTVYGTDARIEYNRGNFYGLLSYGYTNTTYTAAQDNFGVWFGEPVVEYNPSHDRRHQVNAVTSYELGKFTLGARWQFGSGAPFTRPLGFDEILWFDRRFPDVTFRTGDQRILIDKPFRGRLPNYHSLDVSIERVFNLSDNNKFSTKLGAINIYDRKNMFYYDVFTQERINQLPLTAYLSLRLDLN
ncbi:carboxypeptidase regulatory-like domain-containing protein [Gracilimonas sp.]|uniref:TonB-dependent receptor n=1 Tax=Gracilimonas sp. TaxID=1974203 RepID=UPI00287249C0|nr:TonB-dependent receptor [Gracilimonas sp.]